MATSEPICGRHYASCSGGPIVTHPKYERAGSGFDNRDDLAFSDDVVELDQNCLDFPGNCRCYRDFHFHRFDESNLVAVTYIGTGFGGQRAYAPGNFGHNLDFWHATPPGPCDVTISSRERLFVVAADCLR